jgi:hypothetical protein
MMIVLSQLRIAIQKGSGSQPLDDTRLASPRKLAGEKTDHSCTGECLLWTGWKKMAG